MQIPTRRADIDIECDCKSNQIYWERLREYPRFISKLLLLMRRTLLNDDEDMNCNSLVKLLLVENASFCSVAACCEVSRPR